ncbi:MAG: hypothetical protein PVF22_06110 [Candidatus Aminicenantes bacterium]|jgi:hypothetical protein
MKKPPTRVLLCSAVFLFCVCVCVWALAQNLTWETSKDAALSKAQSQQKLILLIVGTDEDPKTAEIKDTICESETPPVKSRIQEMYIPWFLDLFNPDLEHVPYTGGMSGFQIPVICIIHPDNPDECLDRKMGILSASDLFDWLKTFTFSRSSVKPPDKHPNNP